MSNEKLSAKAREIAEDALPVPGACEYISEEGPCWLCRPAPFVAARITSLVEQETRALDAEIGRLREELAAAKDEASEAGMRRKDVFLELRAAEARAEDMTKRLDAVLDALLDALGKDRADISECVDQELLLVRELADDRDRYRKERTLGALVAAQEQAREEGSKRRKAEALVSRLERERDEARGIIEQCNEQLALHVSDRKNPAMAYLFRTEGAQGEAVCVCGHARQSHGDGGCSAVVDHPALIETGDCLCTAFTAKPDAPEEER